MSSESDPPQTAPPPLETPPTAPPTDDNNNGNNDTANDNSNIGNSNSQNAEALQQQPAAATTLADADAAALAEQAAVIRDLDVGENKVVLVEGDTWYMMTCNWVMCFETTFLTPIFQSGAVCRDPLTVLRAHFHDDGDGILCFVAFERSCLAPVSFVRVLCHYRPPTRFASSFWIFFALLPLVVCFPCFSSRCTHYCLVPRSSIGLTRLVRFSLSRPIVLTVAELCRLRREQHSEWSASRSGEQRAVAAARREWRPYSVDAFHARFARVRCFFVVFHTEMHSSFASQQLGFCRFGCAFVLRRVETRLVVLQTSSPKQ
jgi:hypothetical protein